MAEDWFVIWSRYGTEDKIRSAMLSAGLQAWFPKEPILSFDRRLQRMVIKPLGRYTFVLSESPLSPEIWHLAANVDGFIDWLGGEEPTPVGRAVERWRLELNDETVSVDIALKSRRGWDVGDRVEIIKGVWSGHFGECEKITDKGRSAVIKFSALLGRSLGVTLPVTYCTGVRAQ